jgi:L-threonylcarbamoyladenylate synthase
MPRGNSQAPRAKRGEGASNAATRQAIAMLQEGKIGVLLTDTIYGVVGQALNRATVERIYAVKKRQPEKPFIILISGYDDLKKFGVSLVPAAERVLSKYWPGKVSVILPVPFKNMEYLHRGTESLAFRMPASTKLRDLLRETGPLVAPSANPEGEPPAADIEGARNYFGESMDFYLDDGKRFSKPSKLVKVNADGTMEVLRR